MKTYPSTQLKDINMWLLNEIDKAKKEIRFLKKEIRFLKSKKRIKQAYLIGLKKGAALETATQAGDVK